MNQSRITFPPLKITLTSFAIKRAILIGFGLVACIIVGISGFAYPSSFAPLLVGLAYAGLASLIIFLHKPTWALYTLLILVSLPVGLLPINLHSQLNRILTMVTFAVWAVDAIINRRRLIWNIPSWLIMAFLIWSLITITWTANFSASLETIQVYILRFLVYLLVIPNLIQSKQALDGLMRTLAAAGWILIVISLGIVLITGGYTPGTRLQLFDQNQNTIGIILLIALPGILWQALQPGQKTARNKIITTLVYLLLTIIITAMSGSRGSAISLGITILAFCFFRPTQMWGRFSLISLLLAALLAPFVFSTIVERFMVSQGDTVLGGREVFWQAGLLMIRDHPWLGVGIGSSAYAVLPYVRYFQSIFLINPPHQDPMAAIHNPIIVILSETGIPGLLLYCSVLLSTLGLFLRRFYQSIRQKDVLLVPYCAVIFSVFVGFMASWIKGGGMETDPSYFLILSLLLIPIHLPVFEAHELPAPSQPQPPQLILPKTN